MENTRITQQTMCNAPILCQIAPLQLNVVGQRPLTKSPKYVWEAKAQSTLPTRLSPQSPFSPQHSELVRWTVFIWPSTHASGTGKRVLIYSI